MYQQHTQGKPIALQENGATAQQARKHIMCDLQGIVINSTNLSSSRYFKLLVKQVTT